MYVYSLSNFMPSSIESKRSIHGKYVHPVALSSVELLKCHPQTHAVCVDTSNIITIIGKNIHRCTHRRHKFPYTRTHAAMCYIAHRLPPPPPSSAPPPHTVNTTTTHHQHTKTNTKKNGSSQKKETEKSLRVEPLSSYQKARIVRQRKPAAATEKNT